MVTKLCDAPFAPRAIAIDLDEAVGEIDRRVVAHPVAAELKPILRIPGLVEADQVADDRRLRRLGEVTRLLEEANRLLQVGGVQAGRDACRRCVPAR